MELKKNPSADIHKRYPLHLVAGLCVSIAIVSGAFEVKFRKAPDLVVEPDVWEGAVALIDPDFQVDQPVKKEKKLATPPQVARAVVPEIIEVATEPEQTEVIAQTDPFEPQTLPDPVEIPVIHGDPLPIAEVMPEPLNGFKEFYKQVARDVRYPRAATLAEVEGKVFVEFIVDRDGNPTFVRVVKGIGYGCDEQAIKALAKSKWKPGRQRDVPVRVRMIIPIQFSLNR